MAAKPAARADPAQTWLQDKADQWLAHPPDPTTSLCTQESPEDKLARAEAWLNSASAEISDNAQPAPRWAPPPSVQGEAVVLPSEEEEEDEQAVVLPSEEAEEGEQAVVLSSEEEEQAVVLPEEEEGEQAVVLPSEEEEEEEKEEEDEQAVLLLPSEELQIDPPEITDHSPGSCDLDPVGELAEQHSTAEPNQQTNIEEPNKTRTILTVDEAPRHEYTREQYVASLTLFLRKHNPGKVQMICKFIDFYQTKPGGLRLMCQQLSDKYGDDVRLPPVETIDEMSDRATISLEGAEVLCGINSQLGLPEEAQQNIRIRLMYLADAFGQLMQHEYMRQTIIEALDCGSRSKVCGR